MERSSPWLARPFPLAWKTPGPLGREEIGTYGERVAADWLRAGGIRILARNFRGVRGGELDLVARDGRLLLFVEVKTRRKGAKIRPADAVDKAKQGLMERGANAWLKKLGSRSLPWRFDVVEVWVAEGEKPEVNHIRDFF